MYAYNVKLYEVLNADQLDHTFYDVDAKAENSRTPTVAEFRVMLQGLLEDRFKLKVHWETRNMRVYALVTGKDAPKLRASAPETESSRHVTMQGPNYRITLTRITTDDLVDYIRSNAALDRPIVNQTGLTQSYDVELVFTPESRIRGAELSGFGAEVISIFDAVRNELGLVLEQRMAPCRFLALDHAEKPLGN